MNRRLPLLFASLFAVLILAAPGIAAETGTESGDTPAMVPISADSGAAVEAPAPEPIDDAQPWTVRYIFPLLVTLAIVVVGGLIVIYVVTVKGRYRVAAE